MTTIGGFLGLAVQTPIGAAIDETRAKRGAVVLSLAVLALGSMVIFVVPTFWPVTIANTMIAIVGDVFGPAVAALTLGLYARERLARRMGRNSAFDHDVAIALAAGAVGYLSRSGPSSCWCLSSRSCRCSRCSPSRAIPLILPVRAILYTLSDDSFWLMSVQLLDGVGAGIFGALAPLVIADLMRGTGHYNLAQGLVATVQGIGDRSAGSSLASSSTMPATAPFS